MKIEELRAAVNAARQQMVDAHEAIERSLDAAPVEGQEAPDMEQLRSAFDTAETEFKKANERFERASRLPAAIATPQSTGTGAIEQGVQARSAEGVSVSRENDLTYVQNGPHSLFSDLYRSARHDDPDSRERIQRHRKEMRDHAASKQSRDLSSTDAAGGYLVAPLYLQNEFVSFSRAGRVTADAIGSRPLPPSTDSINIPTMDGGTATGVQADNGAVTETDATFNTVAADVKTIAGMQDVAQQLVDRSVPGIDSIIYADLRRDYDVRLDTAVLNSSVTNNKGILQVSGINAVTYTAATPTASGMYAKIADGIQQIHTGVYMPATHILMHPRRWAFFLAALDSSNRPLVVPTAQGPMNAMGTRDGTVAEGPVGTLQGVPVWVDPNIPITLGSGTNEDRVIIAHGSDLFLWEDPAGPYLETFRDIGSGTLTVRFRLHNYYAQLHARRPKAISVLSGTGLATPSF